MTEPQRHLLASYATTEREYLSEHAYTLVYRTAMLDVVNVFRIPCGRGAASKRYRYSAQCRAPADAAFVYDGTITVNVFRKLNPDFSPTRLAWVGDRAACGSETSPCS